jgi:hypothetical protein
MIHLDDHCILTISHDSHAGHTWPLHCPPWGHVVLKSRSRSPKDRGRQDAFSKWITGFTTFCLFVFTSSHLPLASSIMLCQRLYHVLHVNRTLSLHRAAAPPIRRREEP